MNLFSPMRRVRCPEIMDDPHLNPAEHDHALRSLNFVNRWLGADRQLAWALERFGPLSTMSIADVATGGGGFLTLCARRRKNSGPLMLALDRSEFALNRACKWSEPKIRFVVGDAMSLPWPDNGIDLVTCSLFLHHFDEPQVVAILRELARVARKGVIISDLTRSRLAWVLTWLTTHIISRSRVFHVDGIRSVRAAYRPSELAELARQAGLSNLYIKRMFPFRMLLIYRKPD